MRTIWLGFAAVFAATSAGAAQYAYPARGQDKATQDKDKAECSAWATGETGFDPAKAVAQAAKPQKPKITSDQAMAALGAFSGKGSAAPTGLESLLGAASAGGSSSNTSAMTTALSAFGGKTGGQAATALQVASIANQVSHPTQAAAPAPATPGQADYDQARAACLTARGYSVR